MNIVRSVFGGGSAAESGSEAAAPSPKSNLPASSGLHTLKPITTLDAHGESRVWMVCWHPSGKILASCSSDKTVNIWGRQGDGSWKILQSLEGEHSRTVRCVSWSPDGECLACSSFDATVSIWRRNEDLPATEFELELENVLDGHENEVKSVAWSSDGQYVATCSRDKTVWLWDRATGEFECAAVLSGHSQDVKCVAWSTVGRFVLSCGYDDTIKLWEETPGRKDDWHCTQTLVGHESTVWEVKPQPMGPACDPDSQLLLSVSDDTTAKLWRKNPQNEGRWAAVATVTGVHDRTVFSCDWAQPKSADQGSGLIALAAGDDSVSLVNVVPDSDPANAGVKVETACIERNAHTADVNCVRFAPQFAESDPLVLASCGDDGAIRLWEVGSQ